jgi:alpha-L-rhamnosidase
MAATAGSNISLALGEWLGGDSPKSRNAGGGAQTESYTLAASNPPPLQTLFVWHGFQYVLLTATGNTGFSGSLDAITGLEIYTGVESRASICFGGDDSASETAASLLNRINAMARASMLGNVAAHMVTGCPTAEKRGYLGDASFSSPGTLWDFAFEPVYRKFFSLIRDAQTKSGDVPESVPCPHPHTNISACM